MTSECDVTKSAYPVTMTTIRHCSIREFGRGRASNQAVAPGIARPLHATESGLYEFHSCALCCEVSHRELVAKIPSLTLALETTLIQSIIQPLVKISDHR